MNQVDVRKEIQKFFDKGRLFRYKRRTTFLQAGDVPQGVHYLKKGYVRLYSISPEGKELTLVIYEPGDFFPVVWGLKEKPSAYYFEALTNIELVRMNRTDFVNFITGSVDIYRELVDHIIIRFQTALKRMEYLTFGNSHAKVASIFMILAERFGEKKDGTIMIRVPLAHKEMAALTGVTRETTTIEINKLKQKKLVSNKKGYFYITDLQGLKKESLLEY